MYTFTLLLHIQHTFLQNLALGLYIAITIHPRQRLEGLARWLLTLSHGTLVTGRIYFDYELGSPLALGFATGIETRPWSPSGGGYAGD